ncbi:MAG: hypothetical protein FWE53_02290 [Firmicutes bacterium]|nr:hypothetical protein [Bacillota bacterium]
MFFNLFGCGCCRCRSCCRQHCCRPWCCRCCHENWNVGNGGFTELRDGRDGACCPVPWRD